MSQAGLVDIEGSHPQIPTSFVTNNGTAVPIANTLDILGTTVANHGIPLETLGSGMTVTIETQYAIATGSSVAGNAGVSSFNSSEFSVDSNGYVSLVGGGAALETLSDDTNTVVHPNGSGNIQLVGHVVEQGSTKFSTIVAGTNLLNINPMSGTRWIVDPLGFNGTHTTISAASTAATAGDTILIMANPNPYTDFFSLKPGVNYVGLTGDATSGNVTWTPSGGALSITTAGTYSLSNIQFKGVTTNVLQVIGSNVITANFNNCYINNATTPVGANSFLISNSSSSTVVNLNNCLFSKTTGTNDIFITFSGTGTLNIYNSTFLNPGGNTNVGMISILNSGTINITNSYFQTTFNSSFSLPGSGGTINIDNCSIDTSSINISSITLVSSTNVTCNISNSRISSGSASAISIASGSTVNVSNVVIDSSNTNIVTGGGTFTYSEVAQISHSGAINASTNTQNTVNLGTVATGIWNGTTITPTHGGTGVSNPAAHTLPVAEGSSSFTFLGPLTNGQLLIGSTSNDPSPATLTAGTGVTITNGAGTITIASSGAGMTWTDQSGSFNAVVGNGYFLTGASTPTLPVSPSEGDVVAFICDTSSTVTVTGNTGQKIRIGAAISASAGTAASSVQGNALTLHYRSTGTTWIAESLIGTWIVT